MISTLVTLFYILFFALSFLAFVLYLLVFFNRRSALIRYLLVSLALWNLYVMLRIIWEFINVLSPPQNQYAPVLLFVVFTLWYGLILIYIPRFFYSILGMAVTRRVKIITGTGFIIHILFILYGFVFNSGAAGALVFFRKTFHGFVGIFFVSMVIYLVALVIIKYSTIKDRIVRKTLRLLAASTSILVPWMIFELFIKYTYNINFIAIDIDAGVFIIFIYNCIAIYIFFEITADRRGERFLSSGIVAGLSGSNSAVSESIHKYEKSSLKHEEMADYYKKLRDFMERDKPYLDPDIKFDDIAAMTGTTRNRLSQILNQYGGMNFYDFINSYRVRYVIELFHDPESKERTILEIAFMSGFNSKATFNSVFKKNTGKSPSEYRDSL